MGNRRIQGYFTEDDYKNIISIIVEIQIKSLRANNQKCSYGDAMKEVFHFYANHYGYLIKGTDDVKPYYYRDSYFKDVFATIEIAEKYGIGKYDNKNESFVIEDIVKLMGIRNEYKKRDNLLEIRDRKELWKVAIDYFTEIRSEYQKFKEEEDLKSAEKKNNKEIENNKHAKT